MCPAKEIGSPASAMGSLVAGHRAEAEKQDDQICVVEMSLWLQKGERFSQTWGKTRARELVAVVPENLRGLRFNGFLCIMDAILCSFK